MYVYMAADFCVFFRFISKGPGRSSGRWPSWANMTKQEGHSAFLPCLFETILPCRCMYYSFLCLSQLSLPHSSVPKRFNASKKYFWYHSGATFYSCYCGAGITYLSHGIFAINICAVNECSQSLCEVGIIPAGDGETWGHLCSVHSVQTRSKGWSFSFTYSRESMVSFLIFVSCNRHGTNRALIRLWMKWRSFAHLYAEMPRRSGSSSTTTAMGCPGPPWMARSGSSTRWVHHKRFLWTQFVYLFARICKFWWVAADPIHV